MKETDTKKTDDLLAILKHAENEGDLKRYLRDTEDFTGLSFQTYFNRLLKASGISKASLVKRSGIERTYLYQLLNGTRSPGRDHLLRMCIGTGLTLEETTRCMEQLALGVLYAKNPRDAILICAINRGYTVDETNALLYDMKEATLN